MTEGRRGPVIAVDGPSGVGKSTVSRYLAERLGLKYVNTGSMYRALALAADASGVDLKDEAALEAFCARVRISYDFDKGDTLLDGKGYSAEVRSQRAGELASVVSVHREVRELLVGFQRSLGKGGSVVMEGRDIGTVVFPDADFKIYMDASHEARAARRHAELAEKGASERGEVSREIGERDRRDSERKNSPLKKAEDAVYVDTTDLGLEEVKSLVLKLARERLGS